MSCAGPLYERLWRPLLTAGLNTDPPEGSAALAVELLRGTLAAGGRVCHPLIAVRGLSQSFVDPALAFLAARGATIRFGERVLEVGFMGSRAVALEFESGALTLGDHAAAVIAVPPWIARELLPGVETPDAFHAIVNAHFHQGEARDLRRYAGAKRQASSCADAVGQYRACRRLDPDWPSRHDRRRGAFGL
jgi:hypothetical protein